MTNILEARNVSRSFGALKAVDNVSVGVEEGSVVGLIGTNGAGKTTFVNMITGYLKPDAGSIRYRGNDFVSLPPRDVTRLGICRSFQIPQLYDTMTVRENLIVALGIVLRNQSSGFRLRRNETLAGYGTDIWQAADTLLERLALSEHRDRLAGVLPEGIRKLLDIALALVPRPQVILLDEPTSGVSHDEKFDIMDRVMSVVLEDKVTVLFVEHDMDIVRRYAQRVIAFSEGRVLADGAVETVLADAQVCRLIIGSAPNAAPAAERPTRASAGGVIE